MWAVVVAVGGAVRGSCATVVAREGTRPGVPDYRYALNDRAGPLRPRRCRGRTPHGPSNDAINDINDVGNGGRPMSVGLEAPTYD